jgi:hypothetical protein
MLRGLIFAVIFATGFAAGGLFPSYSMQYQQRIQAQFLQASADLAPFQEIADQYHGGSMAALIQHHLNSSDPTFYAEGQAIQTMLDSHAELAASTAALEQPLAEQLLFFMQAGNREVAVATWKNFTPALVTTRQAVVFSLTTAAICSLLAWLGWNLIGLTFRR